jgi:O-antigen/teichoic acid export membrane protein
MPLSLPGVVPGSGLLKGGAWALGGKALGAVFALAMNALLARLLSLEQLGAFFLVSSVVLVSAIVAQAGLAPTVVRLVAESIGLGQPARARAAAIKALVIGTIGAVSMAVIFAAGAGEWIAIAMFRSAVMGGAVVIAAIWIVPLAVQGILGEAFRGFNDIRSATIFGGLFTSALFTVLLAALWLTESSVGVAEVVTLAIAACVTSVAAGLVMLGRIVSTLPRGGKVAALDALSIAIPLLVTNVMGVVLTQADLWIVGVFRTENDVAIYGAASRVAALVIMPLWITNSVVAPLIAHYFAQERKQELQRLLRTTAMWAGYTATAITLVFVTLGEELLAVLFGPSFRTGTLILILLSLGQLANVLTGACGMTLVMTGHQQVVMWIAIIFGTSLLITAIGVAPAFGVVGVAAVVAVFNALQNVATLIVARKLVGVWTHCGLPDMKLHAASLK